MYSGEVLWDSEINNSEIVRLNVFMPYGDRSEGGNFEYMDGFEGKQQLIHNPTHVSTYLIRNTPHAHALRNLLLNFNLTVCKDVLDA